MAARLREEELKKKESMRKLKREGKGWMEKTQKKCICNKTNRKERSVRLVVCRKKQYDSERIGKRSVQKILYTTIRSGFFVKFL